MDDRTIEALASGEPDPHDNCKHPAYSQDKVTGECRCDQCGKLLIDSIGRVLE